MSSPTERDLRPAETEKVAVYLFRPDAELACAVLRADGIRALLVDDSALGYNIAGYQIRVRSADADRARTLIDELQEDAEPIEPSSDAVRARQVLRYLLIAWLAAWAFFLVSAFLGR